MCVFVDGFCLFDFPLILSMNLSEKLNQRTSME